jgi:predicted DNA-binding mobile mystery protein A
MSGVALAKRLDMTTAGARKLETAEEHQVITLASLRKLAAALDCELKYALVPRNPLSQMLNERALTVASERLRPVSHSMSLEDQSVQGEALQLQIDLLAKELLEGSRRELW